ncbi:MAG: RDD family protein, partial [Catalinimonas sp.]
MRAAKQQFSLDHLRVDDRWQGAHLAGFGRRAAAVVVDLLLIVLASQALAYVVTSGLLWLLVRRRLRRTTRRTAVHVRRHVRKLDGRLLDYEIDDRLRRRFRRHMEVYLHLIIWGPVVVAAALVLLALARRLTPAEGWQTMRAGLLTAEGWLTRPFVGAERLLDLATGYAAGFLYFSTLTYYWRGQTPGKRLFGMRVVKLNGRPLTFWNSVERCMGYSASSFLLLGFLQY